MLIAQKVLQDNAFWAHSENLTISMLSDSREEVRRKAVLWVMKARREFNQDTHPRQFISPTVNFEAHSYFDMIDWHSLVSTEPPLTMDLSVDEILNIIRGPIILADYPNLTQSVERMVRVVTEVAPRKAGYRARHRAILELLESRALVPKFNTKKDDSKF